MKTIFLDSCPVCSSDFRHWKTKTTSFGDFNIVLCNGCGFAFVNPRPTLEYLRSFYSKRGHGDRGHRSLAEVLRSEEEYPNSTIDAKRMIKTIIDILGAEPAKGRRRFLDVGCGYGFFSREALRFGFEVTPLEFATTERAIAEEMTGLKPLPTSFEDFSAEKESYDVILMSQILEHAWDVNLWVEKAYRLLTGGGVLAIALPNFASIFRLILQEKDPYIAPPSHLNFFTPKSLSLLLGKYGFMVREIQWVSRISPRSIAKRLPLGKGLAKYLPVKPILRLLDVFHLGMMINVYGVKG